MTKKLLAFKKDGTKVAEGNETQVEIKGLTANTVVAAGDYKVAWDIDGVVTDTTDVPGFTEKPTIVTGVEVDKTATVAVGKSLQIKHTLKPSTATNKKVTWRTGDVGIATVTETGLVEGVTAGDVDITVTTDDGSFIATCKLTVTE